MKKIKLLFIFMVIGLIFISCNYKTTDNSGTIPSKVKQITFYNGGGIIGQYDDAKVKISIHTIQKAWGNNLSYYVYTIETKDGVKESIVDSECLAIKFIKYDD